MSCPIDFNNSCHHSPAPEWDSVTWWWPFFFFFFLKFLDMNHSWGWWGPRDLKLKLWAAGGVRGKVRGSLIGFILCVPWITFSKNQWDIAGQRVWSEKKKTWHDAVFCWDTLSQLQTSNPHIRPLIHNHSHNVLFSSLQSVTSHLLDNRYSDTP